MKILVTGSNGQLGSEIRDLKNEYDKLEFIFTDLVDLDICNIQSLYNFIIDNKINTVINCAAYTSVDKAEENKEIAEQVNSIGVSNIVKVLEEVNGKLIHISTDYVFDGNQNKPYKESDSVCPIGVYGKTKRLGEVAVINSNIDGIVIRTSWLYSSHGNNFVKTILKLAKEKESLKIIDDQVGTPTCASNLAKICLDILLHSNSHLEKISKKGNIYHYSNEGVASWYDFAISVLELGGLKCKVIPIQTKDYPTLAKRPKYSVLNKTKIKEDFKIVIPYWRDSLKNCIIKIKK